MFFNGSVKILAGEFRTVQELIHAAIDARTYSADGPTNTTRRNKAKSRFKGNVAADVFIDPEGEIYMSDAYKGVTNGVTTQATWSAADFTQAPGGGEKFSSGKFTPGQTVRFELASRIIYAVATTVIYLDVTLL